MIQKAYPKDLTIVQSIVFETIDCTYPKYYPGPVVAFFKDHHNTTSIYTDIVEADVFLLKHNDQYIATGTIVNNTMNRVFVLPAYQGKGYGKQIIQFLEAHIATRYDSICLHASLPAIPIYLKGGYKPITYNQEKVSTNGDVLFYLEMKKDCPAGNTTSIDLNGRKFIALENSSTGEVSSHTQFEYYQKQTIVWGYYEGGAIKKGFLIGKQVEKNQIEFSYQHINQSHEIRIGTCKSQIEIAENGKVRLYESWQWLDQEGQQGNSILEEL